MLRLKTIPARSMFAALFALLLGVRLLSPAGFMPSFEHGTVAIVACPDAGPPLAHHDHHPPKSEQPCPYAAASAFGTVGDVVAALVAILTFAFAWTVLSTVQSPGCAQRLLPPATGPPILN